MTEQPVIRPSSSTLLLAHDVKTHSDRTIALLKCFTVTPQQLESTPSRHDGISVEDERIARSWACGLIQDACQLLRLPQTTAATAQVLFHRFYFVSSMCTYDVELFSMAAVYLSSKVEEHQQRLRDVINIFYHLKCMRDGTGDEPMEYSRIKEDIEIAEKIMLRSLGYNLFSEHPYKFLLNYTRILGVDDNTALVQLAWNYVNDSFRTTSCCSVFPEVVACAALYLSCRKLKFALPRRWNELFDVSMADVESISQAILSLYEMPAPALPKLLNDQHKQRLSSPPSSLLPPNVNEC